MLSYLDSSAIVKLVVPEPESPRLLKLVSRAGSEFVSSSLATVEVGRAVVRAGVGAEASKRVDSVLVAIDLLVVDEDIIRAARRLEPPELRSLDAIHLASALALGEELDQLVAYDKRLLEAARAHGLSAIAP